jgi:general secretion pathway protein G
MQAKRGFTLVEILIVVVILGILAAIVIPQFTQASTEAKINSLCSDLQTMRSQIQLYKVQHFDSPPGNDISTLGVPTNNFNALLDQLLFCTNQYGATAATKSKERDVANGFIYGPYLERIPPNPFLGGDTADDIVDWTAAQTTVGAWGYNMKTGEIYAADIAAHKTY